MCLKTQLNKATIGFLAGCLVCTELDEQGYTFAQQTDDLSPKESRWTMESKGMAIDVLALGNSPHIIIRENNKHVSFNIDVHDDCEAGATKILQAIDVLQSASRTRSVIRF